MTLHPYRERIRALDPVLRFGRVRKIMPTFIEADGPSVALGALCRIEAHSENGPAASYAEVVRIDRDGIVLSPFEQGLQTRSGARVVACSDTGTVPVGPSFLGRAVDAIGRPLDALGPVQSSDKYPLLGSVTSPLDRISPKKVLETGIRAIDGLLTLGVGQRVGVFAASGVGKTSLMHQIARQTDTDIAVICLVGERGREVEAMWNDGLDADARARTVLVAATSDQSAAMRVRAAHCALAHAEYWRARGKRVLFLLDSVTRLAMAMRELGLAAGEPPTVRAYTPSVFAALPKMVERCGALSAGGAITAVMTVLSESDDVDDPVCELMKSLLDGHIVLSRDLAEQGHFPAIDVSRSVSRQAASLVPQDWRRQAIQVLEWISAYDGARTLIETALYARGSSPVIDNAIERRPDILRYLKQDRDESSPLAACQATLALLAERRS